jgi:molecular chaperone GrpE
VSKDETTPIDDVVEADAAEAAAETANDPTDTPVAETESAAAAETRSGDTTAELSAAQQKMKEYFEGWQRERADFANYKKRAERDLRDAYQNATTEALIALLPVIDDFERAMTNIPDDLAENPWVDGVRGIQRKFNRLLADQGIEAIDPVGEPFDPNRHEAIGMEEDTEVESGYVTTTLQKGYVQGNRVLRPALVRVAS